MTENDKQDDASSNLPDSIFFFDLSCNNHQTTAIKEHDERTQAIEGFEPVDFGYDHELQSDEKDKEICFFEIPDTVGILRVNNNVQHTTQQFNGYCLDLGAAKSVVGRKQYKAFCMNIVYKLAFKPSSTQFRFGKSIFKSLGKFLTRLRVDYAQFVEFSIEIVEGDFPFS